MLQVCLDGHWYENYFKSPMLYQFYFHLGGIAWVYEPMYYGASMDPSLPPWIEMVCGLGMVHETIVVS